MSLALLFPGQGAQTAGFLRRLPNIRAVQEILEQSSNFLGYDVLDLDTDSALSSTISTQLGLVIAGAAFWSFLASERVDPHAVAGMSVGTFAAAVACNAISFEDALRLVQRRAELMQASFQNCRTGMAVVQGLTLQQIELLLRETTELSIANFNSATQFVIAGPLLHLDSFVHLAMEAGCSKASILATAVSSHIPQLASAAQELLVLARQIRVRAPSRVMFSNCHARPITTAEGIREELALNMANPVRWHDIMSGMGGLELSLMIESPPGHMLAGLASESLPDIAVLSAAETRWDVLLLAARRA
jgi:malonate decarboxylase epsilon subunit